ncbi:MAG: CarD family transcriptional regulator [Lachnospiraceae bacterium]|nr:CarD family transcriptional regulator [Lachnospiraceae bacterium]
MFRIGEKVVCGSKGVCSVEKITTLDISGVDKMREYYILKPLYMVASTVYVPVDTAGSSLRRVLTYEEAQELIKRMPRIQMMSISNEKFLEQEYKNCLKTDLCEEWVKLIKTIWSRMQKRIEVGRKVTALDARYLKIAQDCLYGEMAVALSIPRDEVEDFIQRQLEGSVCV